MVKVHLFRTFGTMPYGRPTVSFSMISISAGNCWINIARLASSKSVNSKPGATVHPTKLYSVPGLQKDPNHVFAFTVYYVNS